MNRASCVHRSAVLTLAALAISCTIASASVPVADRAGVWLTQSVETTLVTASGVKTGIDLGPARAAALGHLDSDGVVDLVVAYGVANEAFAVVTLGDPRFRFGAKHDRVRMLDGLPPERPFASESVVYPLPFAPDWAAVGDWDADGDFDVVFAARDLAQLFWMAGDGQGVLGDGREVKIAGGVTAFVSHEVNRRDGLNDLVIAVNGLKGPRLLVFENPRGALSWDPEVIPMGEQVTDIAVDWLDDDGWPDIAAAAGDTVIVVSGRDRRLTLTRENREAVAAAESISLEFSQRVTGLATGGFVGRDHRSQLAVRLDDGTVTLVRRVDEEFQRSSLGTVPTVGRMMSASSSGLPGDDLLVHGTGAGGVELFHAAETKATDPRLESVTAPVGNVSAVTVARLNRDTRDDLVLLREDGSVDIAAPKSRIVIVVDTTDDIDNGGCHHQDCSLREAIISANIQPSGSTITFDLPLGSTIQPTSELPALTQPVSTIVDGTIGSGVFTGRLRIDGGAAGSEVSGITVTGGNATITNLIITNFSRFGLFLDEGDGYVVEGCWLGIDGNGVAAPNLDGLRITDSNSNTIGGTAAGAGNLVSGNTSNGIVATGTEADNVFLGNRVGTNPLGDSAVGNGGSGLYCIDGLRTQVGSGIAGGGNLFSGNGDKGIELNGDAVNHFDDSAVVFGNTVGLDVNREYAIANLDVGLFVSNEKDITIGGSSPWARNVISGNAGPGIEMRGGSPNALISGNFIGTDGSGEVAVGNQHGILLLGAENLAIGGSVAGTGNLISGNEFRGISFFGTFLVSSIEILRNEIGTAVDGSDLGNGSSGIVVYTAESITIGALGAQNTIAFNGATGIVVGSGSSGVLIGPNSISDNTLLGIDLDDDLVTLNDSLDPDTGPNNLQNFPLIIGVDAAAGNVDFRVFSTPSTVFDLQFYESPACDVYGHGEGKTYVGATTVTTDGAGVVTDQVTLGPLTGGAVITATATDPSGNTSEFSMCFDIPYPPGHIFSNGFESGDTTLWTVTVD